MNREKTKPTEEAADYDRGVIRRHPAFGMLAFHRIQGSPGKLFGSELETDHFIRMELTEGSDTWNLSQHWYHGGNHIVMVDMTPAQFAELLTTMNHGTGIPCTIRWRDGEVPDFEPGDTLEEQIRKDLLEDVKEVYDRLKKLRADTERVLAESGLGKAKRETLIKQIDLLDQQIRSNMPFVLTQYQEQVDKVKASAKAEIDAMITHAIGKLGAKSLQQVIAAGDQPVPPPALESTGTDPAQA